MKQPVFRGASTAVVTPFTKDGIDFERMKKLLDIQAENGIAAITAAGTTGENATLEIHEYEQLVDLCVQHTAGRMKIIAGVGGNNTAACVKKARFAALHGADAVLLTPPYYNKTTQAGIVAHCTAVADASDAPVVLYNVPSRTALGFTAETYRILARHENINGVKEASGDFSLIARVAAECAGELNLWSGNDDHTVAMMALGAHGVISVASNLLPAEIAGLCELGLRGDFAAARERAAKLAPLFRLLFVETNPIPVKAAMDALGLCSGDLRLPLVPLTEASRSQLLAELQRLGCAKRS